MSGLLVVAVESAARAYWFLFGWTLFSVLLVLVVSEVAPRFWEWRRVRRLARKWNRAPWSDEA